MCMMNFKQDKGGKKKNWRQSFSALSYTSLSENDSQMYEPTQIS